MGVIVRTKNMLDMPCILKLPEMLLSFIIVIMSRCGGKAADDGSLVDQEGEWNVQWGGSSNSLNLGAMTAYGFFLLVLCQTAGYLCGERSMVQVSRKSEEAVTP